MHSNQNEQVVRQFYEELKTHNIEGILTLLTDNIIWEVPGYPDIPLSGNIKGKPAMSDFLNKRKELLNIANFEPKDIISSGNRVVSFGTTDSNVKSVGRQAKDEWCHVWEIENGKINHIRTIADTLARFNSFQK